MCSFIDNISSKHHLETTVSKLNLMLLTLHASRSVNVGEFYRIFIFGFSFWALFDTQLMNFIWKYVYVIIQDLRFTFTTQRITKVLWNSHGRLNGIRATNSDSAVGMMRLKEQKAIFTGLWITFWWIFKAKKRLSRKFPRGFFLRKT